MKLGLLAGGGPFTILVMIFKPCVSGSLRSLGEGIDRFYQSGGSRSFVTGTSMQGVSEVAYGNIARFRHQLGEKEKQIQANWGLETSRSQQLEGNFEKEVEAGWKTKRGEAGIIRRRG